MCHSRTVATRAGTAADWLSRSLLFVGVPFGLTMLLITPPLQVPDETTHFYRAYQISLGQWAGVRHEGNVGGHLPHGMPRGLEAFGPETFKPGARAR